MNKLFTLLLFLSISAVVFAQKTKVMVMEIKAEIGPEVTRYTTLALQHATATDADIVIVDLNTFGGLVLSGEEIADKFIKFKKPVWVFVNPNAASAGALISIACDSIYMSPAARIGSATVVDASGVRMDEKQQSYMRSVMRGIAETNKRDPKIAEGMVGTTDSISGKNRVIAFSTIDAIKHGYCEGKVESVEEILARNHIDDYTIDQFELATTDKIIAFFINPFISGLLILAIIGGIYFEMHTPGLGFAGLVALVGLVLYLVPYYLNGLAANWEIIALFIGLVLIAVEIFVIPGFGVAGVAGITLTVGSLILIMINNDAFDFRYVRTNDLLLATAATFGGLIGGIGLLIFVAPKLTGTRAFQRIALSDTQAQSKGFTSSFNTEILKGKKGVAQTVLRPSGKVLIDGKLYDAATRGEYIERGEPIEVISQEGTSIQVKSAA